MAFDFKKEYKEFYMPGGKPQIVEVPRMNYVAVRGKGDPNEEGGEYQQAISLVYAVAYTIKMSKKGDRRIEGYFDYVVPPLDGLWWSDKGGVFVGSHGVSVKSSFRWICMLRLPDFVGAEDFEWALGEVARKKHLDVGPAEFLSLEEGLCVQCLHIGSFDSESRTIALMEEFLSTNGYATDLSDTRRHHEIYLSDFRRTATDQLRTGLRLPVKKI